MVRAQLTERATLSKDLEDVEELSGVDTSCESDPSRENDQ